MTINMVAVTFLNDRLLQTGWYRNNPSFIQLELSHLPDGSVMKDTVDYSIRLRSRLNLWAELGRWGGCRGHKVFVHGTQALIIPLVRTPDLPW